MKSTQNQPRSITISMFMLVAIGGIGYLIALNLQPQWMQDFVQWLSPTIPGFARAEQVTKHLGISPLPAQVNIFYGIFGSPVWAAWFCYSFWKNKEYWMEYSLQSHQKMPPSKQPGLLRYSLAVMICAGFVPAMYSIWFGDWLSKEISWRAGLFYSGTFPSFIFLMLQVIGISTGTATALHLTCFIFKLKEVQNG